jgi:hypothetical protein
MRLAAYTVLLALAGTLGVASCGHVTFGSSSQAVPAPPDWGYAYEPQARYPYRGVAALNGTQAARYEELKRELSNILGVHTQVGSRDYSQVWANLDRERALALHPRYDPGQHLLEWRYENLGDTNLDGMVNTSDLLPIARLYDSLPGDLGFNPADTCGFGPVCNGLSGPAGYRDSSPVLDSQAVMDARTWTGYGAQQVGLSYGRAVVYYRVLAGDGPDPASMQQIAQVPLRESTPGWPPRFAMHLPPGSDRYACLQPLDAHETLLRSYVVNLADPFSSVQLWPPA